MEDAALARLLADVEPDRVERTISAKDTDKIGQAICAFANDLADRRQPGVLFIGARDDGGCAGLAVTDELLRNLAAFRSDGNIQPLPVLTVQKRSLSGCDMAVVTVQPSGVPPVRYKGVVWVRVGPRRARASAEEERRLADKRRWLDLPFDVRPMPLSSINELDLDLVRNLYLPAAIAPDVVAQNERPLLKQMASLRLLTPDEQPLPTVLGLLVCGRGPRPRLPGAYIQFLRFDGAALASPVIDSEAIAGPLPELLAAVNRKLEAHIREAVDIASGPTDLRRPDYPISAVRQLVYNAVLHRNYDGTNAPARIAWYSDRIEISNPGGPFGQVTIENFGQPGMVDYRNPALRRRWSTSAMFRSSASVWRSRGLN